MQQTIDVLCARSPFIWDAEKWNFKTDEIQNEIKIVKKIFSYCQWVSGLLCAHKGFRVRVREFVCVIWGTTRTESLFLFRFEFHFVTLRAANLLANYKIISCTICCYQPMRRCSEFENGDGHCAIMRERFQCITNMHRKFQLHPSRVYSPIYCVDKMQGRR